MQHAETVTFGGTGRDRGHALRSDPAALAGLLPQAQMLAVWRGRLLFSPEGLGFLGHDHPLLADRPATAPAPVFLGLLAGRGVFAVDIGHWQPEDGLPVEQVFDAGQQPHPLAPAGHVFDELRSRMASLTADEAEIAATARALTEWHRSHGFCPRCGAASTAHGGGGHRQCTACNTMHFPRTDPVVIMLVTRGNRLLLGRSPGWPEGMYSTLAGFIEPGETMEAAVRREVAEETGVACGAVRYLASQPWPFPASLMLGCQAEALTDAITLDPTELEHALWITREDLVTVMAGEDPRVKPPRPGSIARFLMENWLADRLD